MFDWPVLEWYLDLSPWLRAGVGVLIMAVAVAMFVLGVPFSIWVLILGILALAGAIPNRKSEWGDY